MPSSSITIRDRAISRLAEAAALAVPGCVGMDAKLAGLASKSLPRVEVQVDRGAGTVNVTAEVAVAYPSPIAAVADAVRETVSARVEQFSGMKVTRVNVTVSNAQAGPRVSLSDLAAHSPRAAVSSPAAPEPRALTPVTVILPREPKGVTAPPPRPVIPINVRQVPVSHPVVPPPLPLAPISIIHVVRPHVHALT
ncbi:hypothetical protein CAPI_01340 [Corynebacterium capitovis DSM 44611]|uniref:Asp23/Gls24 family envelope stress response protein n=1 Tax=Corynebacterium capitovis TaxID=131081 RepID=UPI00037028FE|nr:Asp23/Gls24 family envelope stress response protein [Corynebacterium capitovis]WKD56842.1 hypothetical protein CAPI_01340 [Corynebacterium capitovis DSM 44611]